jgi:hypothetical protein
MISRSMEHLTETTISRSVKVRTKSQRHQRQTPRNALGMHIIMLLVILHNFSFTNSPGFGHGSPPLLDPLGTLFNLLRAFWFYLPQLRRGSIRSRRSRWIQRIRSKVSLILSSGQLAEIRRRWSGPRGIRHPATRNADTIEILTSLKHATNPPRYSPQTWTLN